VPAPRATAAPSKRVSKSSPLDACRCPVCYSTEVRHVSWTLSEYAILLEDAVGVYATAVPERDAGLVRTLVVAVAGLKAAAVAGADDDATGLADALWLARTLALAAAEACGAAAPAPRLGRLAALCESAAAACETGIRERARRP
jgi:hypothetical protein